MRPQVLTLTIPPSNSDGIFNASGVMPAGDIPLNGNLVVNGVGIFPISAQVILLSVNNESAGTFTVYGTNPDGLLINETVTGPNLISTTTKFFKTVTRVSHTATTSGGGITCGTNPSVEQFVSKSIMVDWRQPQFKAGLSLIITGVMTVVIEHTYDDINTNPDAYWFPNTDMAPGTSNIEGSMAFPCQGVRARVTSYTSGGGTFTYIQGGAQ